MCDNYDKCAKISQNIVSKLERFSFGVALPVTVQVLCIVCTHTISTHTEHLCYNQQAIAKHDEGTGLAFNKFTITTSITCSQNTAVWTCITKFACYSIFSIHFASFINSKKRKDIEVSNNTLHKLFKLQGLCLQSAMTCTRHHRRETILNTTGIKPSPSKIYHAKRKRKKLFTTRAWTDGCSGKDTYSTNTDCGTISHPCSSICTFPSYKPCSLRR